jgi:murein DD-endopeptidase MepM/ murein hydrolase activator NlpD
MTVAVLSIAVGATSAHAGGGGVEAPKTPKLNDVRCLKTCAGIRKVTAGSKISLIGKHLGDVRTVRFPGDAGDIDVRPDNAGSRTVQAHVPDGAVSGPPKVIDSIRQGDTSPERLEVVPPEDIPDDGGFELTSAKASPHRAFWGSRHGPKVTFAFKGSKTDVRIDVVNAKSGDLVASWVKHDAEPYAPNSSRWNGQRDGGGKVPNGKYRFRIGSTVSGKTESTKAARFGFYDHIFPVRGKHQYWDGFGAPRDGHTHQGQDVGARCGTPLVAARAGRVQWKAYQSAAGNYVVIDAKRDDHDYVYMHLKRPASVKKGDTERTGERIGVVGATGDASGCHLHFEYWKNDWYNGGRALPSVTKVLKRWDSWS